MAHVPPLISPSIPIDTSPEALGLDESKDDLSRSRVKRLSNTVTKLGRSISGKASPPASPGKPVTSSSSRHRRMFSLSRKGKGKERAEEGT